MKRSPERIGAIVSINLILKVGFEWYRKFIKVFVSTVDQLPSPPSMTLRRISNDVISPSI